jgi:diacylglycerol kinase (ATP)
MVTIIINPVSGGATLAIARQRAQLATTQIVAGGEAGEVFLTERRGHGRELAQAAVRRGDRLVVAWGGDGTVNEVGSALVGTQTALGIIPAGSGNGLARELGLPSAPSAAIATALAVTPRPVDVGGRRGFSTYVRLTARELWRYTPGRFQIDGARPVAALLVTFANSAQFGNGARIAPRARIDDGLLDLVVFEERSRLATLCRLPALFTGGVERVPGVSIRQVTEAVVESDVPMVFHVDGEPVQGTTRLEARVHPGVLRVAGGRPGGS